MMCETTTHGTGETRRQRRGALSRACSSAPRGRQHGLKPKQNWISTREITVVKGTEVRSRAVASCAVTQCTYRSRQKQEWYHEDSSVHNSPLSHARQVEIYTSLQASRRRSPRSKAAETDKCCFSSPITSSATTAASAAANICHFLN